MARPHGPQEHHKTRLKPFCASKASQCKSPSGAKEDSPGQARRSKRRPGYRRPLNYLPRPFRRGEGWGEGSVCSVHAIQSNSNQFKPKKHEVFRNPVLSVCRVCYPECACSRRPSEFGAAVKTWAPANPVKPSQGRSRSVKVKRPPVFMKMTSRAAQLRAFGAVLSAVASGPHDMGATPRSNRNGPFAKRAAGSRSARKAKLRSFKGN